MNQTIFIFYTSTALEQRKTKKYIECTIPHKHLEFFFPINKVREVKQYSIRTFFT